MIFIAVCLSLTRRSRHRHGLVVNTTQKHDYPGYPCIDPGHCCALLLWERVMHYACLFVGLSVSPSLTVFLLKNRKSATWSEVSVIWKCMSEIWAILFPTNRGPKTQLFWTTLQLNGNFNGLYLQNETRYMNRSSALTITRGLLHRPKISWTLVHKRLQTRPVLPIPP